MYFAVQPEQWRSVISKSSKSSTHWGGGGGGGGGAGFYILKQHVTKQKTITWI